MVCASNWICVLGFFAPFLKPASVPQFSLAFLNPRDTQRARMCKLKGTQKGAQKTSFTASSITTKMVNLFLRVFSHRFRYFRCCWP